MKTLNFKTWLETEMNIDVKLYWRNCKKANRKWEDNKKLVKRSELKDSETSLWVVNSFHWDNSLFQGVNFDLVSTLWISAVKDARKAGIPIEFGFGKSTTPKKLDFEILSQKESYKYPTEAEFAVDPYYTPMVHYTLDIGYKVNGIEFNIEHLIGSNRAYIYNHDMNHFRIFTNRKDREVSELMEDAVVASKKRWKDYKTMDSFGKTPYTGVSLIRGTDTKHLEALEKSAELVKNVKNPSFVGNMTKGKDSERDIENSYLYFVLYSLEFGDEEAENIDALQVAKKHLAYSLLHTIGKYYDKYDLRTVDGVLEYLSLLCDEYSWSNEEAMPIVKEAIKLQKLIDTYFVNEKEELVYFIKNNVDESTIADELECHDIESLEVLFDIYLSEEYN